MQYVCRGGTHRGPQRFVTEVKTVGPEQASKNANKQEWCPCKRAGFGRWCSSFLNNIVCDLTAAKLLNRFAKRFEFRLVFFCSFAWNSRKCQQPNQANWIYMHEAIWNNMRLGLPGEKPNPSKSLNRNLLTQCGRLLCKWLQRASAGHVWDRELVKS